jgi:hypothetical protein
LRVWRRSSRLRSLRSGAKFGAGGWAVLLFDWDCSGKAGPLRQADHS